MCIRKSLGALAVVAFAAFSSATADTEEREDAAFDQHVVSTIQQHLALTPDAEAQEATEVRRTSQSVKFSDVVRAVTTIDTDVVLRTAFKADLASKVINNNEDNRTTATILAAQSSNPLPGQQAQFILQKVGTASARFYKFCGGYSLDEYGSEFDSSVVCGCTLGYMGGALSVADFVLLGHVANINLATNEQQQAAIIEMVQDGFTLQDVQNFSARLADESLAGQGDVVCQNFLPEPLAIQHET